MTTQTRGQTAKFVRRTILNPGEYRVNFRQIDCDIIDTITSDEACRTTPQMSRIYLRLIQAPGVYWEREGVLRFAGEERDGGRVTGWDQILELTGVASATARKAFAWMSEKGVIGYFAGKNGAGIRIFINRAVSSIREKTAPGQKNLRLLHTSSVAPRTSSDEAGFKESFAEKEILEADIVPHARARAGEGREAQTDARSEATLIDRVVQQIAPQLKLTTEREHERTRQWFIDHALPKAIRVAQASAYDILRASSGAAQSRRSAQRREEGNALVGAHRPTPPADLQPLSEREINQVAEGCAAIFYAQGRSIDQTLSEMNSATGGFLLPDDIPRVRARAETLISNDTAGGER
jgi:hypothetical protein